jgi:hypothetical protein
METRPPDKRLKVAPFAIHATRGLIRNPRTRRKVMGILLVVALVMIGLGLFGLGPWLEPREHAVRFILFWFACGWVTFTVLLLALMDLLFLRAAARQVRKALREETAAAAEINSQAQEVRCGPMAAGSRIRSPRV